MNFIRLTIKVTAPNQVIALYILNNFHPDTSGLAAGGSNEEEQSAAIKVLLEISDATDVSDTGIGKRHGHSLVFLV